MKKILIVEDDKSISQALTVRLKHEQFSVDTAADVVQAINCVAKSEPDLILLDISIPAGDGFLVVERVKALPNVSEIPFIFLTADKRPEIKEKAISAGAAAFFEKPFDSSLLLNTIKQLIN